MNQNVKLEAWIFLLTIFYRWSSIVHCCCRWRTYMPGPWRLWEWWSYQLMLSIRTPSIVRKAMKISHFNPNQSAPSIYIMIELCFFSLDQWEIRIHLLWGISFNIPLHCDPHLNQTKWLIFNDLLPLTIPGVLGTAVLPKPKPNANLSLATGQSMKILKICLQTVRGQDKIFVPVKKWALVDSEAAPLIPVAAALNKK